MKESTCKHCGDAIVRIAGIWWHRNSQLDGCTLASVAEPIEIIEPRIQIKTTFRAVVEAAVKFVEATKADMTELEGTESMNAPVEFMDLHSAVKAYKAS